MDPGGILLVGAFFSFLTFILGWLLFGVASFRAAVFPRVASVVLIGGTLILFPSPLFPPSSSSSPSPSGGWGYGCTAPEGDRYRTTRFDKIGARTSHAVWCCGMSRLAGQ
ncbi:MAG: hypothetical protein ACR2K4_00350 [Candidatus Limnocylindria bacterium]